MKSLLTVLVTLISFTAISDDYTDYAAHCEASIGSIPDFSCADGVTVPITVNGIEPTTRGSRSRWLRKLP